MKKLIASCLFYGLLVSSQVNADINKCKGADGKLYYTDKQCPSSSTLEDTIANKSSPTKSSGGTDKQQPEKVDFGNGIYQQFSKAKSIVKMAAVEGRNCEWSISVKGNALECQKFASLIVEGGAYIQAVKKVVALANEDKKKEISEIEYNEVLADAKKVVKYKNYMLTSLGIN